MLSNDSVANVGNVIGFCPAGNSVNPLITSGFPFDPPHRRWAAIGGAHAARGGCASLQRGLEPMSLRIWTHPQRLETLMPACAGRRAWG